MCSMPNTWRVLVVDDCEEDRETYRRLLTRHSATQYTVMEANCGSDGLRRIVEEEVDCVVLDYCLPDVDGIEFLEQLKQRVGDRVVPVIMLTGEGSEQVAVEAMKLGAQDYLVKGSLTADLLHRTVVSSIEKSSLRERLRQAEERSQFFAHAAAHDLRAPVRHIGLWIAMLLEDDRDELSPAVQKKLGQIEKSAGRMQDLISALLSYAEVGASSAETTPVALGPVISTVLLDLEEEVQQQQAVVTVLELPTVEGNSALLGQLFQNLLTNALKYRKPDCPSRVTVTSQSSPSEGTCTISVADQGIGFDQTYANNIFEPFQRLVTNAKYPGSGIGMATAKRIVALHGGTIRATGVKEQGATFTVTLPLPTGEGHVEPS